VGLISSAERVSDLLMKVTVGMMLKGVEVSGHKLGETRMAVADHSPADS